MRESYKRDVELELEITRAYKELCRTGTLHFTRKTNMLGLGVGDTDPKRWRGLEARNISDAT